MFGCLYKTECDKLLQEKQLNLNAERKSYQKIKIFMLFKKYILSKTNVHKPECDGHCYIYHYLQMKEYEKILNSNFYKTVTKQVFENDDKKLRLKRKMIFDKTK